MVDQSSHLVYLYIKQQTYENLSSIGRRSCEIMKKEKTLLSHEVLRFQNQIRGKLLLLFLNYVTSEGAVSHNVSYYQLLPLTRYQERLYANNYFE